MEPNQPASTTSYTPASTSPGMFGSKIPSTIAFAIGVLVFFLPFVDIKCNDMSLQQVSGIQLATGFQMKNNSSDNSLLDDFKTDKVDKEITKATTKTDKKDPNMYAMIALGLGVLGVILSFVKARGAIAGAMVTGIASAGALIGMMMDIKKKAKLDLGSDKVTDKVSDLTNNMKITIEFTPWFYISVIAFLAAAVFCYLRMRGPRKTTV